MKKIILLTAALGITCSAIIAQKTTFGIKGGIQQTAVSLHTDEGDDIKYTIESPGIGALVGFVADMRLTSNFSVQPNLLFSYKGGKMIALGAGNLSAISVDLPINALYHHNGFFIGAGPNFSYGITGKIKPFDDGDEDMDFYKGEDGEDAPIKRFEIGVNAMMGYQFPSGFGLSANFTRGLNNLVNGDDAPDNVKFNFKQFGLSFTYMFNMKK
jgi:hypothetical protein